MQQSGGAPNEDFPPPRPLFPPTPCLLRNTLSASSNAVAVRKVASPDSESGVRWRFYHRTRASALQRAAVACSVRARRTRPGDATSTTWLGCAFGLWSSRVALKAELPNQPSRKGRLDVHLAGVLHELVRRDDS